MTARSELWQRIRAAGLVTGDMPAPTADAGPWYVKAMIAVAAWIASLLLLVFFGILFHQLFESRPAMVVFGLVVCGGCAVVMHLARNSMFVSQVAVAMSLAGQALIGFGVLDQHWRSPLAWGVFAAIEAVLVVAAPNVVHRVLTTIVAAWSLRVMLTYGHLGPFFLALSAAAFVIADRMTLRSRWAGWVPVSAALALTALFTIPAAIGEIFWWPLRNTLVTERAIWWIAAIALAVVLLASVASILREQDVPATSRMGVVALAAAAAVALTGYAVPGIVVAIIVLITAFAHGRRALCGLAIVGMIAALSHYYFSLELTLLQKSAALLATGVVLLVAGLALRTGVVAEVRHA